MTNRLHKFFQDPIVNTIKVHAIFLYSKIENVDVSNKDEPAEKRAVKGHEN